MSGFFSQEMVAGTKPFPDAKLTYFQLDHWEQTSMKLVENIDIYWFH